MEVIQPTISAVVIAKNEEPRIAECLKRLAWADEIIVIDNGSTDHTVRIAKRYKARVVRVKEGNFSLLRNRGKSESKGMWIVYIDADEWVTKSLKDEITTIIRLYKEGDPVAYYIQRKNYYLGVLWPTKDKMQRLFYKKALIGWYGILHETANVQGDIRTLQEPLIHTTHRTLEEMVAKTNEWSEIEARLRLHAHHPPMAPWRLFRVMVSAFFHSYIGQKGYQAGIAGCIESIYQAFSMFITYAKLWELQQKQKKTIETL